MTHFIPSLLCEPHEDWHLTPVLSASFSWLNKQNEKYHWQGFAVALEWLCFAATITIAWPKTRKETHHETETVA